MIYLTERYMFNDSNKTIEAIQRHLDLFMLILLLLSSLVCVSRFVFDKYFSTATYFSIKSFSFYCFVCFCPFKLVYNYCKISILNNCLNKKMN